MASPFLHCVFVTLFVRRYALAGSVFSKSRDRAFSIARRVQGGTVLVNDFGIAYLCQV